MVILKKRVVGLSEGSLKRFVWRARRAAGIKARVDVLVTTGNAMRSLNWRFRGRNKATDVLSFPATSEQQQKQFAGEVAISADIAAQNAARFGHAVAAEVKILALHGILHLAGFDHERDNGEMARKETKLRRDLKLPSALIERGQPARKAHKEHRASTSRPRSRRTA